MAVPDNSMVVPGNGMAAFQFSWAAEGGTGRTAGAAKEVIHRFATGQKREGRGNKVAAGSGPCPDRVDFPAVKVSPAKAGKC